MPIAKVSRWSASRCFLLVLASLLLCFATSCTGLHDWKRLERPWTNEKLAREDEVRVLRVDQPSLTLRRARVETLPEGARIVGLDAEDPRAELAVPLERVSSLEARRVDAGRVALVLLVVLVLVSGVVTIGAESQLGVF